MKTPKVQGADRKPLPLGELVGRGGEGEVYAVIGDDSLVAKIYTGGRALNREPKVKAMLDARLAQSASLVSYPNAVLLDEGGRFAGFLMRKIANAKPLHQLYKPIARKRHFPGTDFRFLVHVALNVAKAVASVHRSGCVIGDVNESGVLVTKKGIVALIDADSFQLEWNGKRFICEVGKPEYTAPELQSLPLKEVIRSKDHDAFALAVVVFQLLWMGRHPFSGVFAGRGEMPLEKAIAERRFAYSMRRKTNMSPPPGAAKLDTFPNEIIESFESAFERDGKRPTAEAWINALSQLQENLRSCANEPLHHFPKDALVCPWCEVRREQGIELFPPAPLLSNIATSTSTWSKDFDILEVWKAIERINPPPHPQISHSASSTPAPSKHAIAVKRARWERKLVGVLTVAGAIGIIAAIPAAWPVWIGLAWFGLAYTFDSKDESHFRRDFDTADKKWADAVGDWIAGTGITRFDAAKAELVEAKRRYEALGAEEKNRLEKANLERRDRHLRAWLEQFQISRSRIKGIGSTKVAMLASFGIETAAEVDRTRVLRVPGFGPVNSKPLLDWRRRLEARFVYDSKPDQSDLQREASIRSDISAKAAKFKLNLLAGPGSLSKIAAEIANLQSSPPTTLLILKTQRDQAEADLKHLGLPVPPYRHIQAARSIASSTALGRNVPQSSTRPPSPSRRTAASIGQPKCPHCSSTMVKRTARQGSNAGNQFWGCSRYPRCRGTRPI